MEEVPVYREIPTAYISTKVNPASKDSAYRLQRALEEAGIRVLNPYDIDTLNLDLPKEHISNATAETCWDMICASCAVVLCVENNADDFGRDCAAELGFAQGLDGGRPVFIYTLTPPALAAQVVGESSKEHSGDVRHIPSFFAATQVFSEPRGLAYAIHAVAAYREEGAGLDSNPFLMA